MRAPDDKSALAALLLVMASCSSSPAPAVPAAITVTVASVDTRFVTREHFLAAGEMQISGEPLAEAMQRDLKNYSRAHLIPDLYFDKSPTAAGPWLDPTGFSSAIESYEYSKQPMNNVALESGAGTSLVFGPLEGATTAALATRVQHFAEASHAFGRFAFAAGTYPVNNPRGGNLNPNGVGVASQNPLGWPGLWPTLHVFRSFDPTIAPTGQGDLLCAISSDDDPGKIGSLSSADYECDANTLHLVNRAAQIDSTITPGADGFSGWKYGLWVLNYLQSMHDSLEGPIASVADDELPNVGSLGNEIVGADTSGAPTLPGSYLGSSDIEGFQASMFIDEMDNRAQDWLSNLTTTDGASLGGFASISAALAYDEQQPLRWFPAAISVSETAGGEFPQPSYSLADGSSDLLDQLGLAMGFANFYALTDRNNADVGGAQSAIAYFDGDPFAADDQLADGEATLHDRALAMIRVVVVNIARMHTDAASGYLVDSATLTARGATVSTTSVAYSLLGLRAVARSLTSQLELYSNNTPDTAIASTPLDEFALHDPVAPSKTFSQQLNAMISAQAELLFDHLTDATGRAYDGWNVATAAPIDSADTLDAHTAAVRGLFAAYLATGDVRYRDRAVLVYQRIEAIFYDQDARVYSATPAPVDTLEFTPLRFALLQSTLRDMYELIATGPGGEFLAFQLEDRIGRLNKLVLNGWDDRNADRIVEWPEECASVIAGIPRGGLQMAERTLSGETGSFEELLQVGEQRTPTFDRERDCVPEIDDAKLPSALADKITFHITRPN